MRNYTEKDEVYFTNFLLQKYTEEDLISFGNFLLSSERKNNFFIDCRTDDDVEQSTELVNSVHQSDIDNWKSKQSNTEE